MAYHPRKDWSHLIADYKAEHVSQKELSERYGITRQHVTRILQHSGVPVRKIKHTYRHKDVDHKDVLRVYREGGRSTKEMAALLGISAQMIYNILRQHNVDVRIKRTTLPIDIQLTDEQEQNILKLFEEFPYAATVATKMKLSKKVVSAVLVKHNAYMDSKYAEHADEWKFFHEQGMSILKIHQFCDMPEDDISNTLKCVGVAITRGKRKAKKLNISDR